MTSNNLQQRKGSDSFASLPIEFEKACWITNSQYLCAKKKSPVPTVFCKQLSLFKDIACATVYCTAMGIYELEIDGTKVGDAYFAPGFTSYKHQLQVQRYDVTDLLKNNSKVCVTVAGGWAVGEFNYNRKSQIAAKRTSLKLLLVVEYTDGTRKNIVSDGTWQVSQDGPVRFANWYDGETYDATTQQMTWHNATVTKLCKTTKLLPQYGPEVKVWNTLKPIAVTASSNELVYDFGQNFAGVISFEIDGKKGQTVTFRHGEILTTSGELNTKILRTAKQTVTYVCRDGIQSYSPHFTYMGFRYVAVSGVEQRKIKLTALAISSELHQTGTFECSNELLNKLQQNTCWSARSNFVDIPTDCPQRDERLGWTGDISIFARTACYNYDMSAFFNKWLKDVQAEQSRAGGIPMVVPRNGHEWPPFTTAVWGECCILVPWAEYQARGDREILRRNYPTMRRFICSAKRWAGLFSVGKHRYIWRFLFQFGDWCAPEGGPMQWLKKGLWIATAYFANSCNIMAQTATLLGYEKDAAKFTKWRKKIENAYRAVFTNGKGALKKPFQSAYVLPLYFGLTQGEETKQMAANLAHLVEENGNKLSTGFPSTPYLLFALADNGYADLAYKVLLQEDCPGWLYAVKCGATTIWERWNAVQPNKDNSDDLGSLNHYAYGSVCDFFYRRILGIEATTAGYKTFNVHPVLGGNITWAKGGTETPFGKIFVSWKVQDGVFDIQCEVPQNTTCTLTLPNGEIKVLTGGEYEFNCNL